MSRKQTVKPQVRVKIAGRHPTKPIKVPQHTDPIDVADAVISELHSRTPVDTGRATAGWEMSMTGSGNIRITNNVPYVKYLQDGSSKQAPRGFVNQSLEAGRQVIRENRE